MQSCEFYSYAVPYIKLIYFLLVCFRDIAYRSIEVSSKKNREHFVVPCEMETLSTRNHARGGGGKVIYLKNSLECNFTKTKSPRPPPFTLLIQVWLPALVCAFVCPRKVEGLS